MEMKALIFGLLIGLVQAPTLAAALVGYERNNGSFWTINLTSGDRALLGRGSALGSFEDFEYAPLPNEVPEPRTLLLLAPLLLLLPSRRKKP